MCRSTEVPWHSFSSQIEAAQISHGSWGPVFSSTERPVEGFTRIVFHTQSGIIADAKVCHGVSSSLFGGHAEPFGSPEAMVDLAQCYWDGLGVEKDLKQAESWFQKAAELGYTFAIERAMRNQDTAVS